MSKDIDDIQSTQEQIAEFFANNKPTSQILDEEFKQRGKDIKKDFDAPVTRRIKALLEKLVKEVGMLLKMKEKIPQARELQGQAVMSS